MIEINLLPGPKKKRRGLALTAPSLGGITKSVKDPLLLGLVGAWAVAAVVIGGVWVTETAKMSSLEPQLEQVRNDERTYRGMIAEKRRMETLRDSLVVELDAIREIDSDRYTWAHILEEVTKALPDFTWLVAVDHLPSPPMIDDQGVEIAKPAVRFSIEGRTSDIQAYTRFVRQLNDSPWLTDIQFGASQTVREEEREVTSFRIEGTYSEADSVFIRTAPVSALAQ